MSGKPGAVCPICGTERPRTAFRYDSPPQGETPFPLRDGERYEREYRRCAMCGLRCWMRT